MILSPPGPTPVHGELVMVKILAVILVIALISLFNVGLALQRRQRMREEMERKFDRRRPQWKA